MRCPVEQICVEAGKVTGVRLAGKHPMQINCSTVVSAAGFLETLGEHGLIKQSVPRVLPVLRHLRSSDGFTMCNVSISGCTAEELGLTQANVWWQPCVNQGGKGIFKMCEDFFDEPDLHAAPMMLTFPSMKDRSWKITNPLQHTAQVLILSKASWFTSKDLAVNSAGNLLLLVVACAQRTAFLK